MTAHIIMKWIFILCIASLIMNGIFYLSVGNSTSLINIFSAIGFGVITGIGTLMTRNK